MTPHEKEDVRRDSPGPRAGRRWDVVPIVLGAAAVIFVGVLLLNGGRGDPNPVTGRDAPSTAREPSR